MVDNQVIRECKYSAEQCIVRPRAKSWLVQWTITIILQMALVLLLIASSTCQAGDEGKRLGANVKFLVDESCSMGCLKNSVIASTDLVSGKARALISTVVTIPDHMAYQDVRILLCRKEGETSERQALGKCFDDDDPEWLDFCPEDDNDDGDDGDDGDDEQVTCSRRVRVKGGADHHMRFEVKNLLPESQYLYNVVFGLATDSLPVAAYPLDQMPRFTTLSDDPDTTFRFTVMADLLHTDLATIPALGDKFINAGLNTYAESVQQDTAFVLQIGDLDHRFSKLAGFPKGPLGNSSVCSSELQGWPLGGPWFTDPIEVSDPDVIQCLYYEMHGEVRGGGGPAENISPDVCYVPVDTSETPAGCLFRNYVAHKVPFFHMWDDHDFCGQDEVSATNCIHRKTAVKSFKASYPMPFEHPTAGPADQTESSKTWYSFSHGDAEFLVLDVRSNGDRWDSPPTGENVYTYQNNEPDPCGKLVDSDVRYKSRLDSNSLEYKEQSEWLVNRIEESDKKWLFVVSTSPFNKTVWRGECHCWDPITKTSSCSAADVGDSWASYNTERQLLQACVNKLRQTQGKPPAIMFSGDIHTGGGLDNGDNAGLVEISVPYTTMAPSHINLATDDGLWSHGADNSPYTSGPRAGFVDIHVEDAAVTIVIKDRKGATRSWKPGCPLEMTVNGDGTISAPNPGCSITTSDCPSI